MAAFKVMNDLYLRQIIFNNFRDPLPPNYEFGEKWADDLCLGARNVADCPEEHLVTYNSLCDRENLMGDLEDYFTEVARIQSQKEARENRMLMENLYDYYRSNSITKRSSREQDDLLYDILYDIVYEYDANTNTMRTTYR